MRIPNHEECVRVLKELEDEPSLTEWESNFIESNLSRTTFSDAQKEVVARLVEKYDV